METATRSVVHGDFTLRRSLKAAPASLTAR